MARPHIRQITRCPVVCPGCGSGELTLRLYRSSPRWMDSYAGGNLVRGLQECGYLPLVDYRVCQVH